jgi:hypothetical protein
MDLKPKVFERVTVVLHSCIGADGTKRSCVGYRSGKLRIGNPQHPPLQDGVPDPEQVTDILISHQHGTLVGIGIGIAIGFSIDYLGKSDTDCDTDSDCTWE